MTPTTDDLGAGLVTDARMAALDGNIRGLSKADQEAVDLGADLGQVVNVRRKRAGLTIGSSVMDRGGRPTPQGILRSAESREQAIRLLERHGYVL